MNALPPHLQFGVHGINGSPDGRFELDAAGRKAVVLNIPGPGAEPTDLVAWFPNDPWKWWLRFGAAAVLGTAAIERAEFLGCPLTLFSTPQAWLFAKGKGACVLRWNIELTLYLGTVDRIVADSPPLAARINAALGRGHRITTTLTSARAAHVA